jgi:hypothetical protein
MFPTFCIEKAKATQVEKEFWCLETAIAVVKPFAGAHCLETQRYPFASAATLACATPYIIRSGCSGTTRVLTKDRSTRTSVGARWSTTPPPPRMGTSTWKRWLLHHTAQCSLAALCCRNYRLAFTDAPPRACFAVFDSGPAWNWYMPLFSIICEQRSAPCADLVVAHGVSRSDQAEFGMGQRLGATSPSFLRGFGELVLETAEAVVRSADPVDLRPCCTMRREHGGCGRGRA